MKSEKKKIICYLSAASGDWGGASRVLFTNIRLLDRSRYDPLVLLPSQGPILPLLEQLAVRYVIWGARREPDGLLRHARDIAATAAFYHRNRVDLVHVNHAN